MFEWERIAPITVPKTYTEFNPAPVETPEISSPVTDHRGAIDRIFDALSADNYAIANAMYHATDKDKSTGIIEGFSEGLSSGNPFGNGNEGGEKVWSDVLGNLGWQPKSLPGKIARGAVGLTGDILLSPSSYLDPFSIAGKVIKGTGMKVGSKTITPLSVDRAAVIIDKVQPGKFTGDELKIEAEKFANNFNSKIGHIATNKKDVTLGFDNIPFADKVGLDKFSKVIMKDSTARKIGDKTIAPWFNKGMSAIRQSKAGSNFNKNQKLEEMFADPEKMEQAALYKRFLDLTKFKDMDFEDKIHDITTFARQLDLSEDEMKGIADVIESGAFDRVQKFKEQIKRQSLESKVIHFIGRAGGPEKYKAFYDSFKENPDSVPADFAEHFRNRTKIEAEIKEHEQAYQHMQDMLKVMRGRIYTNTYGDAPKNYANAYGNIGSQLNSVRNTINNADDLYNPMVQEIDNPELKGFNEAIDDFASDPDNPDKYITPEDDFKFEDTLRNIDLYTIHTNDKVKKSLQYYKDDLEVIEEKIFNAPNVETKKELELQKSKLKDKYKNLVKLLTNAEKVSDPDLQKLQSILRDSMNKGADAQFPLNKEAMRNEMLKETLPLQETYTIRDSKDREIKVTGDANRVATKIPEKVISTTNKEAKNNLIKYLNDVFEPILEQNGLKSDTKLFNNSIDDKWLQDFYDTLKSGNDEKTMASIKELVSARNNRFDFKQKAIDIANSKMGKLGQVQIKPEELNLYLDKPNATFNVYDYARKNWKGKHKQANLNLVYDKHHKAINEYLDKIGKIFGHDEEKLKKWYFEYEDAMQQLKKKYGYQDERVTKSMREAREAWDDERFIGKTDVTNLPGKTLRDTNDSWDEYVDQIRLALYNADEKTLNSKTGKYYQSMIDFDEFLGLQKEYADKIGVYDLEDANTLGGKIQREKAQSVGKSADKPIEALSKEAKEQEALRYKYNKLTDEFNDRLYALEQLTKNKSQLMLPNVLEYAQKEQAELKLLNKEIDEMAKQLKSSGSHTKQKPLSKSQQSKNKTFIQKELKKFESKTKNTERFKPIADVEYKRNDLYKTQKHIRNLEKIFNPTAKQLQTLNSLKDKEAKLASEIHNADIVEALNKNPGKTRAEVEEELLTNPNKSYLQEQDEKFEEYLKEFNETHKLEYTQKDLPYIIDKMVKDAEDLDRVTVAKKLSLMVGDAKFGDDAFVNYAKFSNGDFEKLMQDYKDVSLYRDKEDVIKTLVKEFNDMGKQEVKAGLLSEKAYEALKDQYIPHILTDDAIEYRLKEAENHNGKYVPHLAGLDRSNRFNKMRIFDTITEGNDKMKDKVEKFLETNLSAIYLTRALENNKLLFDNEVTNVMKNLIGKTPSADGKVLPEHSLVITQKSLNGMLMNLVKKTNEKLPKDKQVTIEKYLEDLEINPVMFAPNLPFIRLTPKQHKLINEWDDKIHGKAFQGISQMPDVIVDQMNKLSRTQYEDMTTDLGKMYDKFIYIYKMFNTALIPGFHANNLLSNQFNSFLSDGADMLNPNRLKNAHQILHSKNPNEVIKINGKDYTHKELIDMAKRHNIVNNMFFTEDMPTAFNEPGFFEKKLGLDGKYDPTNTGKFVPYKVGLKVGEQVEGTQRFALFLKKLQDGKTPYDAADEVNEFLFDYSDLTDFEKNTMKRIFPFYTWLKKNTILQAKMLGSKPDIYRNISRATNEVENMSGENEIQDSNRQDWQKDLVQMPWTFGDKPVMTNPKLPYQDIERLPLQNGITDLVNATSPLFKIPMELAIGKTTYNNQDIDSLGKYFMDQTAATKGLRTTLSSEGDARILAILNNLTGFKSYQYSDPGVR